MSSFKIESGVQLLSRLTKKPNIIDFYPNLFPSGPTSGDVIEISSEINTSYLLADIISEVLVQTRIKGNSAGVLIFNTDGNLNYDHLVRTISRKIYSMSRTPENELQSILTNLHLLDIYDATQLYATIYKLENILNEHTNISIIMFNTLTAFYWSEQGFKMTKMDLYTKTLINKIQKVTKEYKTILLYTRPEYFCTNKDSEINYQIQLLENDMGNFQVNIRTSDYNRTCFFTIVGEELKWL